MFTFSYYYYLMEFYKTKREIKEESSTFWTIGVNTQSYVISYMLFPTSYRRLGIDC